MAAKLMPIEPGIKIAAQMSPEPAEEDLQFARQMGVDYVVLWTDGAHTNYDYFASRREVFEKAGLRIYGFGNRDVHNQDAIVLNLPNRDEKVEQYRRYLRDLGFNGVMIPDHIPRMANDPRVGTAYTIAYMKALLKRANEEGEG